MATSEIKQLLLQIDASTELLRRNLSAGERRLDQFNATVQRRLDDSDRRFERFGRPLTGIGAHVAQANARIATLGNSMDQVERRMRASSAGIKAALLSSVAGIGAALGAQQVKELADSYTRFTNQLKIAGLEGSNLASVQEQLFAVAQRNGAPLEDIGTLYGRAAQSGKALGASQSDLLRLTGAVGAALKIQGGTMDEARGAMLQLSQALGAGTVRAEEYNSINEGLRPILVAVADASSKYRGDLAKLRSDVIAGKLSSKEFFDLLLKGYDGLQEKASRASLTIGASLTILNNALGQQIGRTDAALSATERLSQAIVGLANNLDLIIPALAGIAAGYAAMKGGQAVWAGIVAVEAKARDVDREMAAQVLRGNASYVNREAILAKVAVAAAEAASAEVAAIETTVAAQRQEAAQLETNLALIRQQRAEAQASQAAIKASYALGFGTIGQGGQSRSGAQIDAGRSLKAEQATKVALGTANARLAASEAQLAAAQTARTAATTAATTATAAATIGARAAAAATALLSGAMSLLVTALPVIAIGAMVAGLLAYRQASQEAEDRAKGFADRGRELAEALAKTAQYGGTASTAVAGVGTDAQNATPKVAAFAGVVGDAAQKLYELARAHKAEAIASLNAQLTKAKTDAADASRAYEGRQQSGGSVARLGYVPDNPVQAAANADALKRYREANRRATVAQAEIDRLNKVPLSGFVSAADRPGGRDLAAEIVTLKQDLAVARARKDGTEVRRLTAEISTRKGAQDLMKEGSSFESAYASASAKAQAVKAAGDQAAADKEREKAARGAATEKRREEAAVRDAAADARAYAGASRQADNDIAAARGRLTTSIEERAAIEKARIESERVNRDEEIVSQGPGGSQRYNAAQVAELQGKNAMRARLEAAAVDADVLAQQQRDALDLALSRTDNERDLLSAQAGLVFSARARREIEMKLLDLAYERERTEIEGVLASRDATEAQKQIARERRAALDGRQAIDRENVERQNAGPMGQYRQQLQANVGDINEALEGVQVNAFRNLEDGMVGVIEGTETVASAFKKMAAGIIADLARIAIQRAIVGAIGGGFGFSGGGRIEGFAGGGMPRYAGGGLIAGPGTGTSDSILAMVGRKPIRVANGEFIMNARATAQHLGLLRALNGNKVPRFAEGGLVSPGMALPRITGRDMRMVREARAGSTRVELTGAVSVRPAPQLYAEMQDMSLRTAGATAEPIMAGAEARTMRKINRGSMPGGYG
ncbi:MAG: tape measure protein [Sphingomonas fennica]